MLQQQMADGTMTLAVGDVTVVSTGMAWVVHGPPSDAGASTAASGGMGLGMVAGAAGGGLLLILLVVIIVMRRRRTPVKETQKTKSNVLTRRDSRLSGVRRPSAAMTAAFVNPLYDEQGADEVPYGERSSVPVRDTTVHNPLYDDASPGVENPYGGLPTFGENPYEFGNTFGDAGGGYLDVQPRGDTGTYGAFGGDDYLGVHDAMDMGEYLGLAGAGAGGDYLAMAPNTGDDPKHGSADAAKPGGDYLAMGPDGSDYLQMPGVPTEYASLAGAYQTGSGATEYQPVGESEYQDVLNAFEEPESFDDITLKRPNHEYDDPTVNDPAYSDLPDVQNFLDAE